MVRTENGTIWVPVNLNLLLTGAGLQNLQDGQCLFIQNHSELHLRDENAVNRYKNYTEVNNLSKYAVTKKIFVKVSDKNNDACTGCKG